MIRTAQQRLGEAMRACLGAVVTDAEAMDPAVFDHVSRTLRAALEAIGEPESINVSARADYLDITLGDFNTANQPKPTENT